VGGTPFDTGTYTPDPLAQFLGRVVPWSVADPPDSFVNIHAFGGGGQVTYRGGGRAYANMAEYGFLQGFVQWLNRINAEVFFCISAQSQYGLLKGNHRTASRKRENARLLRALVLDLDVKPTGYPSQQAALTALLPFFDGLGLRPGPIVSTGRGLHAYVILSESITPSVWQPLANQLIAAAQAAGLKIDVGVTRDAVRILRLPTSFNRKDPNNPLECRILSLGEIMPLAEVAAALSGFSLTPGVSSPSRAAVIDPAVLPRRAPIRGADANRALSDLERARVVTSVDLLRTACPVIADSEARGGNGDLEPLWFELAKVCHYVQDGRNYFHDLSSDDPRYDAEQTDAKYDMAQPQGWPACSTIASASSAAAALCKGCAFNGQGQSPINFATHGLSGTGAPKVKYMNGHTTDLPPVVTAIAPIDMPPGFRRTDTAHIVTVLDGEPVFDTPVLSMDYVFYTDGSSDKQASVQFCVPCGTRDTDDTTSFAVSLGHLNSNQQFGAECFKHGLTYRKFLLTKDFMTAWVTQVREARAAHSVGRMGWATSTLDAFAYGGQVYDKNGPRLSTPTSAEDDYRPRGNLEEWKKGANTYVGKGCIEMELLIATAFAAPLVVFTAVDGVVIFARSTQSGMGKTASLETSASVWASRKTVISSATPAATRARLATVNNLPVYHDEFVPTASKTNVAKFSELILNISTGKEHARLDRNAKPRPQRASQTMLVAAANVSLVQNASSADTNAQAARVLEIEMSDAIRRLGIQQHEVILTKRLLEDNYGTAGKVYAEYLGRNNAAIAEAVTLTTQRFQQELTITEGERFWLAAATTLIIGATIGKNLGLVDFDILSMRKYLIDLFRQQRGSLADMAVDADNPAVQGDRVADFINLRIAGVLLTNGVARQGTNRSNRDPIRNILEAKPPYIARIATVDKVMLVSEANLMEFCRQKSYDYYQMRRVLIKNSRCERSRNPRSLGAGTDMLNPPAREYVLEFDLAKSENARFLNLD
jgi:hypothetical protein